MEEKEKPKKESAGAKLKVKNDQKLVAAARELRDRWLEKANEDPSAFLSNGKYEVSRTLRKAEGERDEIREILVLPAPPSSDSTSSPQADSTSSEQAIAA